MNKLIDNIENIVGIGTVEISEKIDLKKLANTFNTRNFHIDEVPALRIRIESPKATILIFSTAKMVLTGLKKESDMQLVFNIVLEKLNRIGLKYVNPKVEIKKIITRNNKGMIKITKVN